MSHISFTTIFSYLTKLKKCLTVTCFQDNEAIVTYRDDAFVFFNAFLI